MSLTIHHFSFHHETGFTETSFHHHRSEEDCLYRRLCRYHIIMRSSSACWVPFLTTLVSPSLAFVIFPAARHLDLVASAPLVRTCSTTTTTSLRCQRRDDNVDDKSQHQESHDSNDWKTKFASLALGSLFVANGLLGLPGFSHADTAIPTTATTATSTTTTTMAKQYDGFAEYAKENQMEQSDVGCFVSKCGDQTKALFSNPRGIKGVSCLGRCKGEQSCATRCFAEFGSEALNDWLSCTIEENECVKVPKNIDNSAEDIGYSTVVKNFDPKSLVGTWYKTDGLNPNYDLFDCQTNTFELKGSNELDMGIFFRVKRPADVGGGFWENALTEHMVVDAANAAVTPVVVAENDANDMRPAGRTMHTAGKMYGLQFSENWYILGESDGSGSVPPFKLVAYKVRKFAMLAVILFVGLVLQR